MEGIEIIKCFDFKIKVIAFLNHDFHEHYKVCVYKLNECLRQMKVLEGCLELNAYVLRNSKNVFRSKARRLILGSPIQCHKLK